MGGPIHLSTCLPLLLRKSLGCGTKSKGLNWPKTSSAPCLCLGDLRPRRPRGNLPVAPTPPPCPLPGLRYSLDNVGEGREQGLGLVLYTMLGTQGLHQGSHFVVVVSRHPGEKTAGGPGGSQWLQLLCPLPLPLLCGPSPGPCLPGLPTHWCSIWKLRCPLNQSLKKDCSTLQVAASCWGGKMNGLGAKAQRAHLLPTRPGLTQVSCSALSPQPAQVPHWSLQKVPATLSCPALRPPVEGHRQPQGSAGWHRAPWAAKFPGVGRWGG